MSKRRVVITGLGLISPVGNDVATGWNNLVAGKSGIGPITRFDASALTTRFAGEVRDFDPAAWLPPKELRHFDTFIHYGVAASLQAFRDSGIEVDDENAERDPDPEPEERMWWPGSSPRSCRRRAAGSPS